MKAIWEALNGKKTYGIVAIFMACVFIEKFVGWDIPGFTVGDDWIGQVLAMLGIGTLRAGISASANAK